MLVLSRRPEETLILTSPHLAEPILVRVLATEHGRVRIGIDAPGDVRILRGELVGEPVPERFGDFVPTTLREYRRAMAGV